VLGRGPTTRLLPLFLALFGLISLFGLTPRLEEIRPLAFGAPPDPAARARFGRLHAASGILYAATLVGAVVLAALHARAEVGARPKKNPARP
jgi:hypothetical protein